MKTHTIGFEFVRRGTSPGTTYLLESHFQAKAIKNGKALKGHCESAHQGKIDQSCPACREILSKMNK